MTTPIGFLLTLCRYLTMPNLHFLCEELVDEFQEYVDAELPVDGEAIAKTELLLNRARAALAELEPVGPMDKLDRLIALDRNDPIPNDLSHLSDAEFNALCPQGEHAPGPEPLSPAAQAVLDAFRAVPDLRDCPSIAAALRAVADQVAPSDAMEPRNNISMAIECQRIRAELLAISDELEGQ